MQFVVQQGGRFLASEDGPTATEYAIMLAMIILAALIAIALVGEDVKGIFNDLQGALPDGT